MNLKDLAEGLKKTVNDYTYGMFGNGYMERQPGESAEQYKNRMAKGLGAASAAFNSAIEPSIMEQFKTEVVLQKLKNALPWLIVGGVGLFIFKKSKKGAKRNRR